MAHFLFFLFGFVTVYAQNPDLIPLTEAGHRFGETEIEKAIFPEIEKELTELDFRGLILEDDSLQNYMEEVMAAVMPSSIRELGLKVMVMKSPEINAAMYMNGVLQINTGLLSALDNEAQLAFVICHELAHLIYRHSLLKYYKHEELEAHYRNSTRKISELNDAFFEYSRHIELEADSLGWALFLESPYSLQEAVGSLEKLPERDTAQLGFFLRLLGFRPALPTHPKNATRLDFLRRQLEAAPSRNGELAAARFKALTQYLGKLNVDLLRLEGNQIRSLSLLDTLEQTIPDTTSLYFKEIQLAKGEIYVEMLADPVGSGSVLLAEKQKQETGKLSVISTKKALAYFEQIQPELEKSARKVLGPLLGDSRIAPRAHRALGLLAYSKREFAGAKHHLNAYLNSKIETPDRRYIRSLLKKMEAE